MRRSDCAPVGSTTNALGTATRRASGLGTREHRLAHAAEHYAQAGRVADLAGGFGLSETAGSAQLRLAPRRCAPAAAPRRSGLPGDAPARRSRRPVAPRLAARVESAGVEAINQELHKRPTSTAVRYCLQWQPLGEDEGAPVGLEAMRTRLANSSAERERGDAILDGMRATAAAAWSIHSRALDYRRWHRFRVARLQECAPGSC